VTLTVQRLRDAGKTSVARGAFFFCSGDQPPVFPLALRDGITLGGRRRREGMPWPETRMLGPLDSSQRDGSSSDGDWSHHCDLVPMFTVVGTEVLQFLWGGGLFVGLAVLSGAVLGAGCIATTSHDRSAVA